MAEITHTCNMLRSASNALHVLPLHSALDTKEQRRVFAPAPQGRRKVVVATNVAETSITIDDIVAVIDSGRVKETSFDPQTNMRRLDETWASRAAGRQRRGRAGRVRAGQCYKLYTRDLEEQRMPERPEPEIRRVPLEQLCLSVRAMGLRDVAGFLARAPTPPATAAVEGALQLLQRMGCLVLLDSVDDDGYGDGQDSGGGSSAKGTGKGAGKGADKGAGRGADPGANTGSGTRTVRSELTALGRQLALIPADLRCGKLMVFGAIFGCLDDCVTLGRRAQRPQPLRVAVRAARRGQGRPHVLRPRRRRSAHRPPRLPAVGRHAPRPRRGTAPSPPPGPRLLR